MRGHLGVAKLLLDAGDNPTETTRDGRTALHIAAYNGEAEICKLLLQKPATLGAPRHAHHTERWGTIAGLPRLKGHTIPENHAVLRKKTSHHASPHRPFVGVVP